MYKYVFNFYYKEIYVDIMVYMIGSVSLVVVFV